MFERGVYASNRLLCLLLALFVVYGAKAQSNREIRIAAVTNSADFQRGLPQQGSLASIFVTGLEGGPGIITAPQDPLVNIVAGVTVWINFLPARILSVAFENGYQQINVQVPWEGQRDPLYVEVFQNGVRAHTEDTRAESFSVFFANAAGQGIVQHAVDYSLVTPENPARTGEYLIAYGINLGPVSDTPPTGAPAPADPLARSVAPNFSWTLGAICRQSDEVSIAGVRVIPSYVGLAPGLVGVYQVNFQVPTLASTGDLPLTFVRTFNQPLFGQCFGNGSASFDTVVTSRAVTLPVR